MKNVISDILSYTWSYGLCHGAHSILNFSNKNYETL